MTDGVTWEKREINSRNLLELFFITQLEMFTSTAIAHMVKINGILTGSTHSLQGWTQEKNIRKKKFFQPIGYRYMTFKQVNFWADSNSYICI